MADTPDALDTPDTPAIGAVRAAGGGFGVNVHLAPADLAGHFAADVVDVSMVDAPA